jgi:dihydroflavonol-4-reductase
MPDTIATINAALLTGLANLTKKPPLLGMATDLFRTLKKGLQFDGSKAERELGLRYTPIRVAFEEEISSHQAVTSD